MQFAYAGRDCVQEYTYDIKDALDKSSIGYRGPYRLNISGAKIPSVLRALDSGNIGSVPGHQRAWVPTVISSGDKNLLKQAATEPYDTVFCRQFEVFDERGIEIAAEVEIPPDILENGHVEFAIRQRTHNKGNNSPAGYDPNLDYSWDI
jgi:hypothetical protein